MFSYGLQTRQLLRSGWDLVHAWEEPYILAGAELAFWTPKSIRLVFRTAQSLNKRYLPPFNLFEKYVLNRTTGWICSGSLVAQNLSRRPGYADRPSACIPLGVDVDTFRPNSAAGEAIRRSLGWPDPSPPIIGYLGRFTPEKGLRLLVTALDSLRTPWRALFVGTGPLEAELRKWAGRHAPGRVQLCTTVTHNDVPPYLCAMDILVAPSQTTRRWKEQFGRMLIEAMACGVAVVGSDSGEIPFVIGDTGLVLPEADAKAWAMGLGNLLENPARRRELSDAGRARAQTDFAWPVVAQRHLDFFESVLDVN
jgi:glycosyltransferase involved in cell wall biosynthesis